MYVVTVYNDDFSFEIQNQTEKLYSGQIVKGINTIDSFTFSLLPSNVGFYALRDFKTLVSVYNTRKKRYEFWGRVLCSTSSMSESGLITKDFTCESFFGYFCDSQQTYVNTKNWTVRGLLQHILDVHNGQLEADKRFVLGEVTVTDDNDNLYLGIQRKNTWETLKEKLLDKLGGEFRFRVVDGVNYLDYMPEIGETRVTAIALSRNMKAITRELDPTSLVTRLIPLGAKLSEGSEERLTIAEVNGGVDYIDDTEAIELYGLHIGYVEFDGVTVASNLLRKGREWLIANNKVPVKYSITALDLSLLGLDIDDFDCGNYHPVQNALLGIDDVARIIKKTIDVAIEVQSTIEVGDNFKTLSDIQREQFNKLAAIDQLQSTTNKLEGQIKETENSVTELERAVVEQRTEILSDSEKIILQALEQYVLTSNYAEYQETIAAQLALLSSELSLQFTRAMAEIENVDGDLQSKYNTITKYFQFDINGLTIGQSDSPFKVVIDNDRYSMYAYGVEVLWIANGEVYAPEITVTHKLTLFDLVFTQDDDGTINADFVGGDA